MTQASTNGKHSGEQDTVPTPERGPQTIGERTRFLLELMRRAYCNRPAGMLGVCCVLYFFLIHAPWLAVRLYARIFFVWPFGRYFIRPLVRLRVRLVVQWIAMHRSVCDVRLKLLPGNDARSPIQRTLARAIVDGNVHNVRILLERGANPSGTLRMGMPFLHFAIRTCQSEIARLLIESGADTQERDPASGTPVLSYAVRKQDETLTRLLLEHGADANAHGITGLTALMEAASLGDMDIVRLLLSAGADPTRKSIVGGTARCQAVRWKHADVVKLLTDSLCAQNEADKIA
jgi:hypothetical protein